MYSKFTLLWQVYATAWWIERPFEPNNHDDLFWFWAARAQYCDWSALQLNHSVTSSCPTECMMLSSIQLLSFLLFYRIGRISLFKHVYKTWPKPWFCRYHRVFLYIERRSSVINCIYMYKPGHLRFSCSYAKIKKTGSLFCCSVLFYSYVHQRSKRSDLTKFQLNFRRYKT